MRRATETLRLDIGAHAPQPTVPARQISKAWYIVREKDIPPSVAAPGFVNGGQWLVYHACGLPGMSYHTYSLALQHAAACAAIFDDTAWWQLHSDKRQQVKIALQGETQ